MTQPVGAPLDDLPRASPGWTFFFLVLIGLFRVAWLVWRVSMGILVGATWAFFSALLKKR